MKVICVSDTHNKLSKIKIPDGDMIIHAGDVSSKGDYYDVLKFVKEFSALPHKHKIFIAGNHDFIFQYNKKQALELLKDTDIIYLEDNYTIIDNHKIYGSPWQPTFYDWAFNLNRGRSIKAKWDLIPNDVDILITHGPPYEILDIAPRRANQYGEHVGCQDLLEKILQIKPKYHIFGHIHNGYGKCVQDDITFINASSLGENHVSINQPIEFEI